MALLSGSIEQTSNLCGVPEFMFFEEIWAERCVRVPLVVACQSDICPDKRRNVPFDFVWDVHAVLPKILHRGFQIFCFPQDDGSDQRVEAGSFVDLVLVTAIAHFPKLVEEDPTCESVSGFSSDQVGACSFSQFQVASPFQNKEGSRQETQFT